MSSENLAISFRNVWKKYSRQSIFHRSLREDIMSCLRPRSDNQLAADDFWALQDVDFSLPCGQVLGFYGPNGAGKSTILKVISGVTYPTRGNVMVNGRIAPLIEIGAGFHPDLTGRENIFMNGTILGMKISEIKDKEDAIISFSELNDFIDMPVKRFSSGMYLRLAFAIAIHCDTDIYLIDEILAVGDEDFQKKCLSKISAMKSRGKTMVIITHNKQLMESIADRIIYIKHGKITGDTQ